MNAITHNFYDILMLYLAQPTHFILQFSAITKGEFRKGEYQSDPRKYILKSNSKGSSPQILYQRHYLLS